MGEGPKKGGGAVGAEGYQFATLRHCLLCWCSRILNFPGSNACQVVCECGVAGVWGLSTEFFDFYTRKDVIWQ